MPRTVEATLDPKGTIHFREDLNLTRSQRVLVTLLEDDAEMSGKSNGDVAHLLSLLAEPAFRDRPFGSAKDLEAMVEQNRNHWDE